MIRFLNLVFVILDFIELMESVNNVLQTNIMTLVLKYVDQLVLKIKSILKPVILVNVLMAFSESETHVINVKLEQLINHQQKVVNQFVVKTKSIINKLTNVNVYLTSI
jgi:hypothetical protein